jgi:LmbE family N-acetylglucosaminyl deacetylase
MRFVTLILFALTALVAGSAESSQPQSPATFPGAKSLLWVGAHPDDETIAAPLIARLCIEEGLSCTFLVMTKGEAGRCHLANGCHPDLGSVRAAEMRRSARLFGAELNQWSLPDGGGISGWTAASGSHDALIERVTSLIRKVNPDIVLTFDPRHGSTCHPDHGAAGDVVLESVHRLSRQPTVYLLETVVTGSTSPFSISFSPGAPASAGAIGFDANQALRARPTTAWQFTVWVAQTHASQFDAAAVRGLAKLPSKQRVVFVAPAALALTSDSVFSCN